MFRRRSEPTPAPEPKHAKQYVMRLDPPAGQCSCRWQPLGGDPWSITDAIIVKEGETLPPVDRGFVHYCKAHGGGSK